MSEPDCPRGVEAVSDHAPAEPRTICSSTGLVYCKACGALLDSDRKGRTARADQPCTPVKVALRSDHSNHHEG